MAALPAWFRRQQRTAGRGVYLQDAFIEGRFPAYAWFRLRYLVLRYIAATLLHGLRVVLLMTYFPRREFATLVLAHVAANVVTAAWWGALEELRGGVRQLARSGRPHRIPRLVGAWLSVAVRLSIAVGSLGLAGLALRTVTIGPPGPQDVYFFAIALRVAVDLVARCYHSGIYAIRRIYRPIGAVVAVEVVDVAVLVAAAPWLGPWSFPTAAFVSAAVSASLVFWYTGRLYRFLGHDPWRELDVGRGRLLRLTKGRELAWAAAAGAALSADSLLVIALFSPDPGMSGERIANFVVLFAIAPTIRAAFEWADLFYFDLKRLEVAPWRGLRRRFEGWLVRLAVLIGAVLGVVATAIVLVLAGGEPGARVAVFAPLLLSQSLLAVRQIRAFADGAYGQLVASAAVVLVGLLTARALAIDDVRILANLAVANLAAWLLLHARTRPELARLMRVRADVLPATEWLETVARLDRPVRVSVARVSGIDGRRSRGPDWRHLELARSLAGRLHGRGHTTVLHPALVAWYDLDRGRIEPDAWWVLDRAAGLVSELDDTGWHATGSLALTAAWERRLLGVEPAVARTVLSVDDIEVAFTTACPSGIVYRLDARVPPGVLELPTETRRAVLADAAAFCRTLSSTRRSRDFEVTAYCAAGDLHAIFLAPRDIPARHRARWRAQARWLNVRAALNCTSGTPGGA